MISNLVLLLSSFLIFNNEGPTYTIEKKMGNFQIRKYDSWIVAQTTVKGSHQDAGNEAFHILAGYIFGKNDQNVKIDMTAPVTQRKVDQNQYQIQFFMPSEWTLETLPKPNDPRVVLKALPSRRIFAERYIGNWSDKLYNKELNEAEEELKKQKLVAKGQQIWARYNSPMTPSFLRTNQIMFEI